MYFSEMVRASAKRTKFREHLKNIFYSHVTLQKGKCADQILVSILYVVLIVWGFFLSTAAELFSEYNQINTQFGCFAIQK